MERRFYCLVLDALLSTKDKVCRIEQENGNWVFINDFYGIWFPGTLLFNPDRIPIGTYGGIVEQRSLAYAEPVELTGKTGIDAHNSELYELKFCDLTNGYRNVWITAKMLNIFPSKKYSFGANRDVLYAAYKKSGSIVGVFVGTRTPEKLKVTYDPELMIEKRCKK